jgi:hypothetical protein
MPPDKTFKNKNTPASFMRLGATGRNFTMVIGALFPDLFKTSPPLHLFQYILSPDKNYYLP